MEGEEEGRIWGGEEGFPSVRFKGIEWEEMLAGLSWSQQLWPAGLAPSVLYSRALVSAVTSFHLCILPATL